MYFCCKNSNQKPHYSHRKCQEIKLFKGPFQNQKAQRSQKSKHLNSITPFVAVSASFVTAGVSEKLKDKYGIGINLILDGQHAFAVD